MQSRRCRSKAKVKLRHQIKHVKAFYYLCCQRGRAAVLNQVGKGLFQAEAEPFSDPHRLPLVCEMMEGTQERSGHSV